MVSASTLAAAQSAFQQFGGGYNPNTASANGGGLVNRQGYADAHPSLSTSISRVPGQLGHLAVQAVNGIYNAAVAGPKGLYNQITGKDLQPIEQKSQAYIDKSNQLVKDYKAGKISKSDYLKALHDGIAEGQGISGEADKYNKDFRKNFAINEVKTAGTALTLAAPFAAPAVAAAEAGGAAAETAAGWSAKALVQKAAQLGAKGLDDTLAAGKGNILGKAVRNAVVTQPTIQMTGDTLNDVKSGHFKQAAINAGLLIGVPLAAGIVAPKVAQLAAGVGKKVFGVRSFLDEIPTSDGKISAYLKSGNATPAEVETAKTMQQYNLNQSHGDVGNAVQFYKQWLGQTGENMSAAEHLQGFQKMVDEVNQYRQMAVNGELPKPGGGKWTADEVKNIWVGRFSTTDRTAINNELEGLNNVDRVQRIDELAKETPWGQNERLVEQLKQAAGNDNYKGEIANLNPTVDLRGVPKDTYVATSESAPDGGATGQPSPVPTAGDGKMKAQFDEVFNKWSGGPDAGATPTQEGATLAEKRANFDQGSLHTTDAGGIEGHGSSVPSHQADIEAAAAKGDYGKVKQIIDSMPEGDPYKASMTSLFKDKFPAPNKYVPILRAKGEQIPGAGESGPIVEGQAASKAGTMINNLGLSPRATSPGSMGAHVRNNMSTEFEGTTLEGQADKVYKALTKEMDNHGGVYDPRQLTQTQVLNALGTSATRQDASMVMKALRKSFAEVPASVAGLGGKITNKVLQDAPFMNQYLKIQGIAKFSANPFFYLKTLSKSGIVALAEGADHFRMTDATDQTLRKAGYFSKYIRDQGMADFLGEDLGNTAGQAVISKLQQNIVGGMAESIAASKGMTVEQALKDPEVGSQLDHAIRVTVGYPKGGYISSPLAKTLNVVLFPSRFETKVLQVAGHYFAKQPPVVQAALAGGIANLSTFMQSDQGKQWQKDNAESIQLMNYFTPTHAIDGVVKFLDEGHHVADLGEVGGLPFGVITQILQHQGVPLGTLESSAYHDPKTGDIVPSKIPTDLKGRTQSAIIDLIGSTFSWPGKQAGFTLSKGDLVQSIPGLKESPADFKYEGGASAGSSTDKPVTPAADKPIPNTGPRTDFRPAGAPVIKGGGAKVKRTVPKADQIQH